MEADFSILLVSAVSIGFAHTILGPDHYLPFILLSKARNWTPAKTAIITSLCGVGHVLGSILLGVIGISFGLGLDKLNLIESHRGNIAAWLLIAFGLIYFIWGVRRAIKTRPHKHWHTHSDGTVHQHEHQHVQEHSHVHGEKSKKLTPWILFIIFVLGPCEALIPLLMYPAAMNSYIEMFGVVIAFSVATLLTMLAAVMIPVMGLQTINLGKVERFSHAFAGGLIFLSGVGIQLLGF
jgi:ABC-type nickel/cobalt efflux system permease component RcnA